MLYRRIETRMATVPTKVPASETASAKAKAPPPPRDSVREIAETIVFVVALVLMLKLFVVEAFVIPTGSMAETLLGYNKNVTCPQCGYTFPVNASYEVDPPDGIVRPLLGTCCPNCRYQFKMTEAGSPSHRSGDRVLVHKALFSFTDPARGDVVVFKYPVDPQSQHTAQNYIKRLWGLGDETIAVHRGDLYVARGVGYPANALNQYGKPKYPRPDDPRYLWQGPESEEQSKTTPKFRSIGRELWMQEDPADKTRAYANLPDDYHIDFTYHRAETALTAFEASRQSGFPGGDGFFELIRKTDEQLLAMRRIVYHNDHQAAKLVKYRVPPRWQAVGAGWKADNEAGPKAFTHSGDSLTWLRYQHRVPGESVHNLDRVLGADRLEDDWTRVESGQSEGLFPPQPITNLLGYNARFESEGPWPRVTGDYWVGDLIVECKAKFSGPSDEVILELGKGSERFRARFVDGTVGVSRAGRPGDVSIKTSKLSASGEHDLRFANVDGRLRVWVNGSAIEFGAFADYSPAETQSQAPAALAGGFAAPHEDGHTLVNDVLAPVMIGAKGSVEISQIVLWQDTYFTPMANSSSVDVVDTFYVQPGHYLCLGDNSGQSSDSRKWGLVPVRLMLGKAVFVFFPFTRIGFID